MSRTAQLESRTFHVISVLESIDAAIGESGAMRFIRDNDALAVPIGLREAIINTAVRMLDEAKAVHKMSPEEFEAWREKQRQKKAERAARGKARRARAARGKEKKEKVLFKKKGEYEKEPRAPRAPRAEGRRPPKPPFVPPPPGAAGAVAVRGETGKPGRKIPRFPLPTREGGPRRPGERGDVGFPGRKRPSQIPMPGKEVGGSVEKLRRRGKELEALVGRGAAGRKARKLVWMRGGKTARRAPPGVPAGRRRRMPTPKHGEFPQEFAAFQRTKGRDLDWLEKERQRRSGIVKKAGKLARMRGRHHLLRAPEHDVPKGYHIDPTTGEHVHSTGSKATKKFANATTFRDTDDDAMLHTDQSLQGSRASADDSEFAFVGDTDEDPRHKWFRVSKEGGYPSAMASLGKAYQKDPKARRRVIDKVKSTGFIDAQGHQIDVKPTGALHNERGACTRKPDVKDQQGRLIRRGGLTAVGKELKRRNPHEWYRLCKGPHGPSGTPERDEYKRGFNPQHDDAQKVNRLHRAAETGKAEKPVANIQRYLAAKGLRRPAIAGAVQSVGRKAIRSKRRYGRPQG